MAKRHIDNLIFENARLIYKNFSGRQTAYNSTGNMEFTIVIDDEEKALELREIGWNIKELGPRDDEGHQAYKLQVAVRFDNYPPTVNLYTKKSKRALDEHTISILDNAEILGADVIVSPSCWEVNGKSGIKAYLKEMHVTIRESVFADKYAKYDENIEPEELPFP